MITPPIPAPFDTTHESPLPADLIAREYVIAARERVRDADAYVTRMVDRFGIDHPDTAHARQLADEARIASAATYREATR